MLGLPIWGSSVLTWTKQGSVWRGNGFRVEQVASGSWVLIAEGRSPGGDRVVVDTDGFVELPTLAACRHKAEELHRLQRLAMTRNRLSMVAMASAGLALFAQTVPLVGLALGVVALGAVLELIRTWWETVTGDAREIIQ